jgi:hypothetical protein
MKTTNLFLLLFLFSISLSGQQNDNTLTPQEFEQGWELLFDGKP